MAERVSWADQGPTSSDSQRLSGSSQSRVSTDSQASGSGAHESPAQQPQSSRLPSAQRRTLRRRSGRVARELLLDRRREQIQQFCAEIGRSMLELMPTPDIQLSRREWNKKFGAWKQRHRRTLKGKSKGKGKGKSKSKEAPVSAVV
mmetsp:Transcript_16984/g.32065  ORF Transcript_16984/g.32065 Transcript_16984/m.32065 type:complete len:146 (+) Transcript_16984:69-506(+)